MERALHPALEFMWRVVLEYERLSILVLLFLPFVEI